MVRQTVYAALAMLAGFGVARAETLSRVVGSTELRLSVPQGFCLLNRDNFRDGIFVAVIERLLQGTNKLIMATAECEELERWRGGSNDAIKDYSMYYTPLPYENLTLPGDKESLRKGLCQEMRKQGATASDQIQTFVEQRAQALQDNIQAGKVQSIGVVGEDGNACYSALLVKATTPAKQPMIVSAVVASTVVKSKALFLALYSPYNGPQTTEASVVRLKPVAAELNASNP